MSDMTPCHVCETRPATVDALDDDQPVRVCAECYEHETGEAATQDFLPNGPCDPAYWS